MSAGRPTGVVRQGQPLLQRAHSVGAAAAAAAAAQHGTLSLPLSRSVSNRGGLSWSAPAATSSNRNRQQQQRPRAASGSSGSSPGDGGQRPHPGKQPLPLSRKALVQQYRQAMAGMKDVLTNYNLAIHYARKLALDVLTASVYKEKRVGGRWHGDDAGRKVSDRNVAFREDFEKLKHAAEAIALQFIMNVRPEDFRQGFIDYSAQPDGTDAAQDGLRAFALNHLFPGNSDMADRYPARAMDLVKTFLDKQVDARRNVAASHTEKYRSEGSRGGTGSLRDRLDAQLKLEDPVIEQYHKAYTVDETLGAKIKRTVAGKIGGIQRRVSDGLEAARSGLKRGLDSAAKALQDGATKGLIRAGARGLMDSRLRSKFILDVLGGKASKQLGAAYFDYRIRPLLAALRRADGALRWFLLPRPPPDSDSTRSMARGLVVARFAACEVLRGNMHAFKLDFRVVAGDQGQGQARAIERVDKPGAVVDPKYFHDFDTLVNHWSGVWHGGQAVDTQRGFVSRDPSSPSSELPPQQHLAQSTQSGPPGQGQRPPSQVGQRHSREHRARA